MLPRDHRLTASREFGAVMRRGARAGGSAAVVTVLLRDSDTGVNSTRWRCGFIVSKAVGNAVVRHRTQRRLRHIVWDLLREPGLLPEGAEVDVVIRALKETPAASHQELFGQVRNGLRHALRKAQKHQRRQGGAHV